MPLPPSSQPTCSPLQGAFPIVLQRDGRGLDAAIGFAAGSEFERLRQSAPEFLSKAELDYFAGLTFRRRQQSYLLGRISAKLALRHPPGGREPLPFNTIDIRFGAFEQPVVVSPASEPTSEPLEVSITHCEQLAVAIAFPAGHPMAVDIEPIDPARAQTMKSQLTPDERTLIGPAEESELLSTVAWTAKEALSKVLKCGLMTPMEVLAISTISTINPLPSAQSGSHTTTAWEGLFKNFPQYQFIAWKGASCVLSMALPKNTRLIYAGRLPEILF